MINKLVWPAIFLSGALAFNAYNTSRLPMNEIAGRWQCDLLRPDGSTGTLHETYNFNGDAWGSMSVTNRSAGVPVTTTMSYDADWSLSGDGIRHRYKDIEILSLKLGSREMPTDTLKRELEHMRGVSRLSKITHQTSNELTYENEEFEATCTRKPEPSEKPKAPTGK